MTYHELIKNLPSDLPKIIIETGTYKGRGCGQFSSFFSKVYTIELSEELSLLARENNKDIKNISYYVGESDKVIPLILDYIEEDYVLFLDAHGSGEDTVFSDTVGRYGSPVIRELLACKDKLPKIVVIDDLLDFENIPSYPKCEELDVFLTSLGYTKIYDVRYKKGWKIAIK